MNQNGKHRNLSAVEVIDAETNQSETAVYDSDNPMLKPAHETTKTKKRSWKRRLIGWSVAVVLLVGGLVALYSLTRINRVNVKVEADSPRNTTPPKGNDQS